MAKIPMTILRSQFFRGVPVNKGDRIETESRKVAAVLTKLGRAREIPDVDLSEPFNLPDKVEDMTEVAEFETAEALVAHLERKTEVALRHDAEIAIGMDLASKDDSVTIAIVPAKRAYKKRAYKRRGPAKRK